ncbi:MAG: metallophosphoesterase [Candidatus Helarchaeota archaeon]|nr:metallophosphoesterase [Candidatus Helarchaeota archaeon]
MIRILAISDIHAHFSDLEEIVADVKTLNLKFDLTLVAGDFSANTHQFPASQNPEIMAKITDLLKPIAPIYGVLGNDDDPALNLADYGIISLENKAVAVGNWTFVGFGGALKTLIIPSDPAQIIDSPQKRALDGVNLWNDETVVPTLKNTLDKIPKTQHICMLTHYHPDAVFPSRGQHPLLGSKGLKAILMRYRPNLWLCGHIHPQVGFRRYFKPTGTLLIRVTCVIADKDIHSGNPFGKVYWILELNEDGKFDTSYKMLATQKLDDEPEVIPKND